MDGDDRNNPGFMGSVLGRAKKVLFPDMAVVEPPDVENRQTVTTEKHTPETTADEKEEEVVKLMLQLINWTREIFLSLPLTLL
jgi:hypothetical protein